MAPAGSLLGSRWFTSHEHGPRRPAGYVQVGDGRRSVEQQSTEGERVRLAVELAQANTRLRGKCFTCLRNGASE
jgi:hypothetical protein